MGKPIVTMAAASMHSAINWRMWLRGRSLIAYGLAGNSLHRRADGGAAAKRYINADLRAAHEIIHDWYREKLERMDRAFRAAIERSLLAQRPASALLPRRRAMERK